MKTKLLFFIPNLGKGGAEKVLVNLLNHIDLEKYDVSLRTLFSGGVNEQQLRKEINYKSIFKRTFRGNIHILKLLPPSILHKLFIKEHYDIEVSYLEGPTARIISGCNNPNTKLVSWIHVEQHNMKKAARSFRNAKEAKKCYAKFNRTICVSDFVKQDFCNIFSLYENVSVLYNTVESDVIRKMSIEDVDVNISKERINLIAVGTLKASKGYERLFSIVKTLKNEGFPITLFVLGTGPQEKMLKEYISENNLESNIVMLGYRTNPYKYVAKADLFVCSSFAEGFSTAATEALIVGTPVCTVDVSGMKEMLGNNNEYGIVTDNNENALCNAIRSLLMDQKLLLHYKEMAKNRGRDFSTKRTVAEVELMFDKLLVEQQ